MKLAHVNFFAVRATRFNSQDRTRGLPNSSAVRRRVFSGTIAPGLAESRPVARWRINPGSGRPECVWSLDAPPECQLRRFQWPRRRVATRRPSHIRHATW